MNEINPFKSSLSDNAVNLGKNRKLNAKSSILIFFSYIGTQILSGIFAGAVLAICFTITNSGFDHEAFTVFLKNFTLPILVFSLIASGLIMLTVSYKYGKGLFKDRSITGIALYTGNLDAIAIGAFMGVLIAFIYIFIAVGIYPPDPEAEVGTLTKMLLTPGPTRIFWILLALFFAPFIEEYLFRGVMLAGFTYSLGIYKASILVTVLFVAVHAFEAIHYPPAFGGITLIAIIVILLRLKYKALGPPIAAHFGYNLVIASGALLGG